MRYVLNFIIFMILFFVDGRDTTIEIAIIALRGRLSSGKETERSVVGRKV